LLSRNSDEENVLKYLIKQPQLEQAKSKYGVVYTDLLQTGITSHTANVLPVQKFKIETRSSR